MVNLIRGHGTFLVALGTGIAIGTTVTIVIYRASEKINRELYNLAVKVENLRREVEELRALVQGRHSHSKTNQSYLSSVGNASVSSGEDDEDLFEEAYGGNELESFRDSTTSPEDFHSFSSNGALSSSISQDQLFSKVDHLFSGTDSDKIKAFDLLQKNETLYSSNVDFRWRFAKATYLRAELEGDQEAKKLLIYRACNHAATAIQLDDSTPSAHKWYAITLGSIGDYEGTQAKIENGYKFKEHIEKAITLQPDDPSPHYLLGRWCFGVYQLSWIERQAAAALYATPPSATVDDALQNFLEAEKLQPNHWKDNMLYIAKCYLEKREYSTAVSWLDKADKIPVIAQDDRTAQKEIDNLLYKYSGYRA